MNNINNNNKLPEWFNREKYKSLESLSLVDWALNLWVRKHILDALHEDRDKDPLNEKDMKAIQDFGVLSHEYLEQYSKESKWFFDIQKDKPGHGIVYSLPLNKAVEIHSEIQADTKLRSNLEILKYQKVFDKVFKNKELTETEMILHGWWSYDYLETTFDEHYFPNYFYSSHLVVELDATDENIVAAFKTWLLSIREKEIEAASSEDCDHPKKVSDSLRRRWIAAEIIPFIDLHIYQELEGINLPLHKIGNAIFSKTVDFDTTEAVRKTTRELAFKALRQSNDILRHALIIEEQNKTE